MRKATDDVKFDQNVHVKVTKEMKKRLCVKALNVGLSNSSYLRLLLLNDLNKK